MNRIAVIDLADRRIEVGDVSQELRRRFLGGRGINTRLLFDAVGELTDPLGPENVLFLGAGLLTGIPWVGATRSSFSAKSPETGHLGDSAGGGYFGAELRFAGFDHLVFKNRADRPVYLWVHDGTIEFRDAGHLEPLNAIETQNAIRRELGDLKVQVAAIGPAGRRLVRWACILHNTVDAWGRTGMGAVMGSKNLWAIAARGRRAITVADPVKLVEITSAHYDQITRTKGFLATSTYGTLIRLNNTRTQGYEGGFNHQQNMTELPGEFDADIFLDQYEIAKSACLNCPTHCRHMHEVVLRDGTKKRGGGPEYGGAGGWGSQCGSSDWRTILEAWDYCNEMGLDVLSATSYTAWLMELYEKGIISERDTDGLALRWGDHDAILGVLRQTVERRGIGALIAEGWMHAAREIGRGAHLFFDHVKGLSIECDDVRGHRAQVLGLATSSRGADHLRSRFTLEEFSLPERVTEKLVGVPVPSDAASYVNKEHACIWTERICGLADALGACKFLTKWLSTGLLGVDEFRDIIEAATGMSFTNEELMEVGDRIYAMERLFLVREGISRKDDCPPEKFYQPWTHGPRAGTRVEHAEFEAMLDRYYALRGWDRNGIPTPETLARLGLEREGAFLAKRREVTFIWNDSPAGKDKAHASAHH
jgi:aldehyde:ferredoxin oxidoreductase